MQRHLAMSVITVVLVAAASVGFFAHTTLASEPVAMA